MEYRSRSRAAVVPWWLIAGVTLVVVLAIAVVVVVAASDGEGGGERPAAWEQLLARHGEDGLSTQLALDAFATMVAPVPGGHPVAADALGTTSATPAVRWMLSQWDELDEAQRAAFRRAVYSEDAPVGTTTRVATSLSLPAQPSDQDPDLEAELQPEVEAIAEDFAARTGAKMPRVRVVVSLVSDEDGTYASAADRTSAAPGSPRGDGRSSTCVITFYPPAVEAREGSPREREEFVDVVAHELYHCHQYLVADEAGIDRDLPDWLVEGAAEWAGGWYADHVRPGYVSGWGWWESYFDWAAEEPRRSLYRLGYDAVGLFAHLDDAMGHGGDIWSTIDAMLVAPSNDEAFDIAVKAGEATFLRRWAMGTFQDPDLGSEWATSAPGMPDLGLSDVDEYELGAGDPAAMELDRPPGIVRARVLVLEKIEMLRADITGHGAFHWLGPELEERGRTEWFDAPVGQTRWYCFTGECTCPGTGGPAPDAHEMPAPSTISVALTGGTDRAAVTLTATTVEELCDRDPQVEPVRDCADVLDVVQRHAPHYDGQQDIAADDRAMLCSIRYTASPELDEFGNYLELGVIDEIMVGIAWEGGARPPAGCPPEGHCVRTRTQHVEAIDGVPAHDVTHTDVYTRHVHLSASEEAHGPQTPTEGLIQITLDIEARAYRR